MDYADLAKLFDNNASAIARHFGVKAPAVFRWKRIGKVPPLRVAELDLQKLRGEGQEVTLKQQRTAEMVAMYKSGLTLAGIGAHYGITRERVRQILKKNGIVRADGGMGTSS